MLEKLTRWLIELGLASSLATFVGICVGIVAIALLAWGVNFIAKKLVVRGLHYLASRTQTKWDDYLVDRKVFNLLSHLAPAYVIYRLVPLYFSDYYLLQNITEKLSFVYMIVVSMLVLSSVLNAVDDIYRTFPVSKNIPLKGFIQVFKIIMYCLGGIIILALLLDKTPLYLLSGIGALMAVLLIVFKDPILGFVGGIQLSANNMISIGDWIEMPSHNADGDVIEIALTTVKVQNWDRTITTVPTYDLISRPFKNWRGMQETGGRRISRSINIDLNSVHFLSEEDINKMKKVKYISEYVDTKVQELDAYNRDFQADLSILANGRHLTNLGTFRAYAQAYLDNHPKLHKGLISMVRQLAPSEHGVPIQIYVFTATTAWVEYEGIQADIFDHLFAVLPEFGLHIFQEPTGIDFKEALQKKASPAAA